MPSALVSMPTSLDVSAHPDCPARSVAIQASCSGSSEAVSDASSDPASDAASPANVPIAATGPETSTPPILPPPLTAGALANQSSEVIHRDLRALYQHALFDLTIPPRALVDAFKILYQTEDGPERAAMRLTALAAVLALAVPMGTLEDKYRTGVSQLLAACQTELAATLAVQPDDRNHHEQAEEGRWRLLFRQALTGDREADSDGLSAASSAHGGLSPSGAANGWATCCLERHKLREFQLQVFVHLLYMRIYRCKPRRTSLAAGACHLTPVPSLDKLTQAQPTPPVAASSLGTCLVLTDPEVARQHAKTLSNQLETYVDKLCIWSMVGYHTDLFLDPTGPPAGTSNVTSVHADPRRADPAHYFMENHVAPLFKRELPDVLKPLRIQCGGMSLNAPLQRSRSTAPSRERRQSGTPRDSPTMGAPRSIRPSLSFTARLCEERRSASLRRVQSVVGNLSDRTGKEAGGDEPRLDEPPVPLQISQKSTELVGKSPSRSVMPGSFRRMARMFAQSPTAPAGTESAVAHRGSARSLSATLNELMPRPLMKRTPSIISDRSSSRRSSLGIDSASNTPPSRPSPLLNRRVVALPSAAAGQRSLRTVNHKADRRRQRQARPVVESSRAITSPTSASKRKRATEHLPGADRPLAGTRSALVSSMRGPGRYSLGCVSRLPQTDTRPLPFARNFIEPHQSGPGGRSQPVPVAIHSADQIPTNLYRLSCADSPAATELTFPYTNGLDSSTACSPPPPLSFDPTESIVPGPFTDPATMATELPYTVSFNDSFIDMDFGGNSLDSSFGVNSSGLSGSAYDSLADDDIMLPGSNLASSLRRQTSTRRQLDFFF
ncbi:hypothetical protein IWQ60_003243 [Tieghemiomyces parasiticus]|uniref:DNA replication regulator Sld3 C-terminal domain-containing protein n=1 Tax=Tieghemiomyces parasiticus TaxID=78921 RepID=A0A9W8AI79_9FUNG|nr:hypothetical protein IWQ60_003243 [Tieghemiomyces parasiticus]